jgi:arabinan endo-1,5-alpha-L-arabinosidase
VQIPDKPAFALTKSLTIEGWVRPRGNGYVIMSRGDHRPGLDPYTLSMQANHDLHFQICDDENNTAIVATELAYGRWTHVAATLDGDTGTMSLYTNGVLAAQTVTHVKPIGALRPEMSPGLGIGNLNDGGNDFPFIGDLDEIALYDRALSVEEINAIYSENAANADGRAELLPPRGNPGMGMRRRVFGNNQ